MGIIDFVKRGVGELAIARPDHAKGQLVYKHPDQTIPNRAQLTVEPDEVAVFLRDGKVVGWLGAGRHTLESDNVRFLNLLVDKLTGGNVWIAEVTFVTTREVADLKFGGRIGALEDPKSGVPVETMVHGTYSLKVTQPDKLLLGLVGLGRSSDEQVLPWLRDLLLKTVRDRVAELLVKKRWPLLDVTSGAYTEELEQEIVAAVAAHVESYGVDVLRLGNFTISIGDEDSVTLKRLYTDAAYVRMAGGVAGYQQLAAGKAMMGAAEGLAKGGGAGGGGALLGGAGLAVGVGLAQQLQQAAHPGHAAAPPAGLAAATVGCGACGAQVAPGRFCAACGKELATAAARAFCPQCGGALSPGAKFCSGCGGSAA